MRRNREYVRIGWFRGIASAVTGAFAGLLVLFASLAMLWWNEGRPNLADIASESRAAPIDRIDPALEGSFVSVTAILSASEMLADPEYLRPARYATLERRAEMYAWIEHRDDHDRRAPRFTYTRAWTPAPPESARFRQPGGHENPVMRVRSARWALRDASLAVYHFAPAIATMPFGERLALAPEMLVPGAPNAPRLEQDYLLVGAGTLADPRVGDVRAAYTAYRVGDEATLFGDQRVANIGPHVDDRARLFRLVPGTRDAALRALDAEHRATRWMLRIVGFMLTWLALNMCLAPLSAMFDIFPPLGRATRSFVAAITFPVAFTLAGVTVVVSAAVHSVFGFIVLIVAMVAFAAIFGTRGRR